MTLKRVSVSLLSIAGLAYVGIAAFLTLGQEKLLFPGAYLEAGAWVLPPVDGDLVWDTTTVVTADGTSTVVLTAPNPESPNTGPWVLYFHGNAGLLGRGGSLERYGLFHEAGFNVAAVEYQGFGVANQFGEPSEEALYGDADAGWAYLTEELGVPGTDIVLYGWSLGSGPATYLAAKKEAAAVATEGAFTAVIDAGAEAYPWLPLGLLVRHRFPNLERAESLTEPWLVFHAEADRIVPFSHGSALAEAGDNIVLYPLDGTHDDAVIADREIAVGALRELAVGIAADGSQPLNR